MELLVCVLNREEKLEELLARLADVGVTGATVIDSRGMGRVLGPDLPAFGSLQDLTSLIRAKNVTIFSVVEDATRMEEAKRAIRDVCGDLDRPSTGIVFTLPLSSVMGLAGAVGATAGANPSVGANLSVGAHDSQE